MSFVIKGIDVFINQVVIDLFFTADNNIDNRILELTDKNNEYLQTFNIGFQFMCKKYESRKNTKLVKPSIYPFLVPELRPEFFELRSEINIVEMDKTRVRQLLCVFIQACNNLTDIVNVLPEIITNKYPNLGARIISQEAAFEQLHISNKTRKEYSTLRPKIEYYGMLHLIQ